MPSTLTKQRVQHLLLFFLMGTGLVEGGATEASPERIEATPYIEAIEITETSGAPQSRTIRSYKAGAGNTLLVSSYLVAVPWNWGEREIKTFTKPRYKVTEGTLDKVEREWWEEVPRTKYPCVPLGRKIMAQHRLVSVNSERGLITTVFEHQLDQGGGVIYLFGDHGEGSRFVSIVNQRGGDSALLCGEAEASSQADLGGKIERRWKIEPGASVTIQQFKKN